MEPFDSRAPDAGSDAERPEPGEQPLRLFHDGNPTSDRFRVAAFDLDAASLVSLEEALPGWEIKAVNGATADSLGRVRDVGSADLLVVQVGEEAAEPLRLCRLLAHHRRRTSDPREREAGTPVPDTAPPGQAQRADVPLLVLVPPGQEGLVREALKAGADRCLILPAHAKEVTSALAQAQQHHRPGRHTLNLEHAQDEDLWRDDGGQG